MSQNDNNSAKKKTKPKMAVATGNVKKKKPSRPKANAKQGKSKAKPTKAGAKSGKASTRQIKPGAKSAKANTRKTKPGAKSTKANIKQTSSDTKSTKADSTSKNTKNRQEDDFEVRSRRRDEERARRREARKRKVRRQKIMIAVLTCVIVAAIIAIVFLMTPSMKLSRSLSKGAKYAEKADYENTQKAYESALEIDPTTVSAYRGLADNYLAQGRIADTEQILYEGWEQTQDEGLLHYYCVEVYNEAVSEINQGNFSFDTVEKCLHVLELEPDNENAIETLQTYCYNLIFEVTDEEDTCMLFFDEDLSNDTCSYNEYEKLLRKMLALYQENKTEGLKNIVAKYALIDMPYARISLPHVEQYTTVLTDINNAVNDAGIADTLACLARAKEVQDYFAPAFTEFEAGNFAFARDIVAEDSYQQIRDAFINEDSGYWEGSIYIPVNKELLVLHREDDAVRFYFPNADEYDNHQGIIIVWGTKQEDDGVQRSVISYEPVEDGSDSHVEYTIQYLYSNVKIGNQYVPQMNYRFDTKITTEEGITTNAIGDWGGEHEWEIDY